MAITAKVQHKGVLIEEAYVNIDLLNLQKQPDGHLQVFVLNIHSEGSIVRKLTESTKIDTSKPSYEQVYDYVKTLQMFTNIQDA